MRFLTDPDVDPTNNAAERLLKPAALLRKNSVFAGSDAGGDRGATMLSVINTCRLLGVDAETYMVWALDRMAERRVIRERLAALGGGPAPPIRYDDLTPAALQGAHLPTGRRVHLARATPTGRAHRLTAGRPASPVVHGDPDPRRSPRRSALQRRGRRRPPPPASPASPRSPAVSHPAGCGPGAPGTAGSRDLPTTAR